MSSFYRLVPQFMCIQCILQAVDLHITTTEYIQGGVWFFATLDLLICV